MRYFVSCECCAWISRLFCVEVCDFGPFRSMIVPPSCVQVARRKGALNKHLLLRNVKDPGWEKWSPLVVIGNIYFFFFSISTCNYIFFWENMAVTYCMIIHNTLFLFCCFFRDYTKFVHRLEYADSPKNCFRLKILFFNILHTGLY